MSDAQSPTNSSVPTTITTSVTDLLDDFRKILSYFDRENQLYRSQINILKDAVNSLQTNEDMMINNMGRELNELRVTLGSLEQQHTNTPNLTDKALTALIAPTEQIALVTESATNRKISDYLCQICLDTPRDCILEPCMHFCICAGCVAKLPETKCPICRRHIEFYQNVFIS
jgi:hypothetical protein